MGYHYHLTPRWLATEGIHDRLLGCGYLPVFTDREAAEREYPGKDIMTVENRLKRE